MEKREFEFTFNNENGLHARPAGELVQKVKEFSSEVTIEVPRLNKTAKADKLFTLMGLGVKKGEKVNVVVSGANCVDEANKLKSFMEEKFSD